MAFRSGSPAIRKGMKARPPLVGAVEEDLVDRAHRVSPRCRAAAASAKDSTLPSDPGVLAVPGEHGFDVLVAAPREVDQDDPLARQARRALDDLGEACELSSAGRIPSVRAEQVEGGDRLVVGGRGVLHPPLVVQPDVLRADRRVVEPGRDRVGGGDLPLLVLEHEGAGAVEHAERAAGEARRVLAPGRRPGRRPRRRSGAPGGPAGRR